MHKFIGCIAILLAIGLTCIFICRKSRQGRIVTDDCINLCMTVAVIIAIVLF